MRNARRRCLRGSSGGDLRAISTVCMAESCTGTKCEEIEVYDVPYFGITLESLRSLVFIILQPETTHLS
jgi:hypothetical protein